MVEISEEQFIEYTKLKNYNKNYFNTTTKFRVKLCDCCNKEYKYNSWLNHLKSKTHIKNINKNINKNIE